jgi:hypothetical protein
LQTEAPPQLPHVYDEPSFLRRLLGDELLEIALFFLTLGIGWFVWLALVAPRGKTPAKDFVNVTIYDYRTAQPARWQQVWLRDVFGKVALPAILAAVFSLGFGSTQGSTVFVAYQVMGGLAAVVLEDRRAVWDYVGRTYLVYEPGRPQRRGAGDSTRS